MAFFYTAVLSDSAPMTDCINYLVNNLRTTTNSHLLADSKQVLACKIVLFTIKR